MTGLEIVGAAAIYILGVLLLTWILVFITARATKNMGLAAFAPIAVVGYGVPLIGAIIGLVLLGVLLASEL